MTWKQQLEAIKPKIIRPPIEFSYVIGFKSTTGEIKCYKFYGGQVQFGSQDDAEFSLNYVRGKSKAKEWKIYKLGEAT